MRPSVWTRRLWLWIAPLGFAVLNAALLTLFQVGLAGEVGDLQREHDRAAETLAVLRGQETDGREYLVEVEESRQAVEVLYREHFKTEAERFTKAISEVKRLARQAGFDPPSVNYPEEDLRGYDLKKRRVVFSVRGSYDQLRTFINFLELTDHFLILERVSLAGGGKNPENPVLSIELDVSTVFVDRAAAAVGSAGGASS